MSALVLSTVDLEVESVRCPAAVCGAYGMAPPLEMSCGGRFPPLDRRAHPITEAAAQWPASGPILLRARVDMMLGRPSGNESRKVIIDLKTGRAHARHRQDLGFYALIETLARSVPPRKLATFYLDAGEAQTEDVSERLLRTAVRRTLDAINAIIELSAEHRQPVRRPGSTCRWCPLAANCAEGQSYLAEYDAR